MDSHGQPDSHFEYTVSHYQAEVASSVKAQAFQEMNGLKGVCSRHKAAVLIDLILATRPEVIVEIGVEGGRSLIPMAFALKANGSGKIFGIDLWYDGLVLDRLIDKVNDFGLRDQVELTAASSMNAPLILNIDILHIDGDQSPESVLKDVKKWVPFVKNGGIVVLNNVTWGRLGTLNPYEATQLLNMSCAKQAHFGDGNNWAIWIKQ